MSWFFNSRNAVLREAQEIQYALRKNLTYSRDVLAEKDAQAVQALVDGFGAALARKDVAEAERLKKESLKVGGRIFPSRPFDAIRENVEVFVVAIVVALGIRSYFLQPFKIPTGSMQPTLNGVQIRVTDAPPPALPVRLFDMFVRGRTYGVLISAQGGLVTGMAPGSITPWFEYTDVTIGSETIRIWANMQAVQRDLGLHSGVEVDPGKTVRFQIDTGDQVLVNKVIYNFRKPKRGEVFVFKTAGIEQIEGPRHLAGEEGSQFYIKRCVGLSGDVLAIDPPYLKVNGPVVHSDAFDRIYSLKDGYRGYCIHPNQTYMKTPSESYTVPQGNYWAMGDNSYQSFDSRYWGPVSRNNTVGTGFIVYWPFTSHWGWIR